MIGRRTSRITAAIAAAAFLLAFALAAAPNLHERLHDTSATHQCAATLIASGTVEHSVTPDIVVSPSDAEQFATVPVLTPSFVATPFLSASIFEHAPPVLS